MKKKLLLLLVALIIAVSVFPLTSCSNSVPEVPYTTVTRITVDALASIEVIVNFQNSVVAVTPLNDAAKVILAGESLIKTTPDAALGRIATLIANAGYLSVVDSINISVSKTADEEVVKYVEVISDMIEDAVEDAIEKSGKDTDVEFVAPATYDELRNMNRAVGYYDEDILATIPDEDLIFAMAQCRVAAMELPGLEFSYAYFSGMDRMYLVFNKEGIADMIKEMGDSQTDTYATYRVAVNDYIAAADAVDKFIHDNYLSPDSDYQKLSAAVRATLANIEKGRADYDAAVAALEAEKTALQSELNTYVNAFKVEVNNLSNLEVSFNTEVMKVYREKATEIFNASLEAEKTFMDTFKAKYADSISAIKAAVESSAK